MSTGPTDQQIEAAYQIAKERYAALGVDTDDVLQQLAQIPISLHCWQGDDVGGFEPRESELGGGLAATGNYPGKARTADELRSDLDIAYGLIPGKHRLALHMSYAETGDTYIERTDLQPEHFTAWVDWAKENEHGLDMNPTLFSHPMADSGFTLSSYDKSVRQFWIEHCISARKIGAYFGKELGTPCITNIWIPDGYKDTPVDRVTPRQMLKESLDEILAEPLPEEYNLDSVESKLFGLGSESYVVGSHDFYLGYALSRGTLLTLDSGHYHPTETIADKISSVLLYIDELMLHVSRGVRWDSDHVVTLNDDTQAIMQEVVRGNYIDRVHIGLDFFDASINRVAAYVIGTRNAIRALLLAMLEPIVQLRGAELDGDFTTRLALLEATKALPFGAVWDYYCKQKGVPTDTQFMEPIKTYEDDVLSKRD